MEAASAQFDEEFASSSEDETSTDELPSKTVKAKRNHSQMILKIKQEKMFCFLARRSVKLITSDLFWHSSPDTNVVKE